MGRRTSRKPNYYQTRNARAKRMGFSGYAAERAERSRLADAFRDLIKEGKIDYTPSRKSNEFRGLVSIKGRLHAGERITAEERAPLERAFGKEATQRLVGQWTKGGVRFISKGSEWYDADAGKYRPVLDYRNKKFKTDTEAIAWIKAVKRSRYVLVVVRSSDTAWEIYIDYVEGTT